jgi:hypothetical protein
MKKSPQTADTMIHRPPPKALEEVRGIPNVLHDFFLLIHRYDNYYTREEGVETIAVLSYSLIVIIITDMGHIDCTRGRLPTETDL